MSQLKNLFFWHQWQRITDLPYRILVKEQGCGLLYTEMVSAKVYTITMREPVTF